jgi:hypothetical protein
MKERRGGEVPEVPIPRSFNAIHMIMNDWLRM